MSSVGLLIALGLAASCGPAHSAKEDSTLPAASWHTVAEGKEVGGALLSVWGTDANHVVAVGGPRGNAPLPSLALEWDGHAWKRLSPGGTETYWWVGGSGADDVWMVGEQGRITHYDGSTFREYDSGTQATLWGVVAFSKSDAWAVGGTPEGGTRADNDVLLRWDGHAWSRESLPGEPLGRSLFKVWGASSDELFVVGEAGTIWHRRASDWSLDSEPPIATGTLFTVHGCSPSDVYAVGGFDVLHFNGESWSRMEAPLGNQVNGVHCGPGSEVTLVGLGGLKQRFSEGTWVDDFLEAPHADLHATWSDSDGRRWVVGGDFISPARPGLPRSGVIARWASEPLAAEWPATRP